MADKIYRVGALMGNRKTNFDDVLENLADDIDLFRETLSVFEEYYQDQLNQIAHSIKIQNPDQVRKSSHTFKGSVSNFGIETKSYLHAASLEKMGSSADLENADATLSALRSSVEELRQDLLNYLDNKKAS